jgi:hypothetical protein
MTIMKYSFIHILVGILAAISCLGWLLELDSPAWFAIITVILLAYVGYETYSCSKNETGNRVLVNPAVLFSFFIFVLGYGVSNINFSTLLGQDEMELFKIDYTWLSGAEALALVGALAMWLGYRSETGTRLANWLREHLQLDVLLSPNWQLNWLVVWICVLISLACRLMLITTGQYGINADIDTLMDNENAKYSQYLMVASQSGMLALFAITLHCVGSKRATLFAWGSLYGVLIYEIIFGILSAFKSQVFLPTLVIVICFYTVRGKVPLAWLAAVPTSIFLGYFVVEPFREARHNDPNYDNRSLLSISNAVMESIYAHDKGNVVDEEYGKSTEFRIVHRLTLTGASAGAIRLKMTEEFSDDAPPFLTEIILCPAYAVIPRVIWPDKPLAIAGRWYTAQITGDYTSTSATAMGAVGKLYVAGGVVAVVLSFFTVGVINRIVYQALWRPGSGGSLLVYLAIVGAIATSEGTIDAVLTLIIRSLPMIVLCQYLLFKRHQM